MIWLGHPEKYHPISRYFTCFDSCNLAPKPGGLESSDELEMFSPHFRQRFGGELKLVGDWDMAVCQNLVPLVNIKIAGKWMFIPLKMVLIGIDPYPYVSAICNPL